MSRVRYFAFRTIQTVVLLWAMLTLLFLIFRLLPGSYADLVAVAGASPETVAHIEEKWGLNDPLYVQYFRYLWNFIQLDMGTSLVSRTPVWEYVRPRILNSALLAAPAITAAYFAGSTIGVLMGWLRGSRVERVGTIAVIFMGAFPSFFIAIVLVIVFASWIGLFPTGGMVTPSTVTAATTWYGQYFTTDFAIHYVLPFTAVFMRYLYMPSLVMRTNVVDVLDQDFVYYHKMTGIPIRQRLVNIGKHASLPVITLYPVTMVRAVSGIVLVETVFNWPGIGFTLVAAVQARDYPVVQFVFFAAAAFVILSNYVVDLLYGVIDPRVSVED